MENNDIHNNYGGIYVVKGSFSYAHHNNIYDNREYGVESAKAYDDTIALFDAISNWWGDSSGPSSAGNGAGDAISKNVDFNPWLLGPAPVSFAGAAPVKWAIEDVDSDDNMDLLFLHNVEAR